MYNRQTIYSSGPRYVNIINHTVQNKEVHFGNKLNGEIKLYFTMTTKKVQSQIEFIEIKSIENGTLYVFFIIKTIYGIDLVVQSI